ncbi:MAG: SGNH/GDSL hydrolase family protein, partial [Oscillospiraceae bacterium]
GDVCAIDSNIYHTASAQYDSSLYTEGLKRFEKAIVPYNAEEYENYLADTLFVGDSNTAGLSSFGYLPLQNVLGKRSMAIQSVSTDEFVWFSGQDKPVSIIQAISLLKPRRVIINFGTNNTVGTSVKDFASIYSSTLKQVKSAYPYADIIVASILPVGKHRENMHIKMQTIDSFNLALAQLCVDSGYYFLNLSEAFKSPDSGFMKPKYVAADGVHLNSAGYSVFLKYVADHKLILADRRPPRGFVPMRVNAKPLSSTPPEFAAEPGEEVVFPPSLDNLPQPPDSTAQSSAPTTDTPQSHVTDTDRDSSKEEIIFDPF